MSKLRKVNTRNLDAWQNIVTGMGSAKDKKTYTEASPWAPLDEYTCENLYTKNSTARKCARLIPNDAIREGVSWNMEETTNNEKIIKYLDSEFRRLKIMSTFNKAWIQANVHGGACALIVVDDGARSLSTPLRPEKVKAVKSLRVFNRRELTINPFDVISDLGSPHYGHPLYYTYNEAIADKGREIKIHHTRMIRFDGSELDRKTFIKNGYWHDSIYNHLYDQIMNYGVAHDAVADMVYNFQTPLYKIEGMSEAIDQDEEQLIIKKVQIAHLTKSMNRALVLDKQDEFENTTVQVSGLSELVELLRSDLVVGMDVPKTKYLGESPSGLSGTGYAETISYYDGVKVQQDVKMREPLEFLTDLIFNQDGAEPKPEGLVMTFNPLFQLDRETEEKSRFFQAQIDEKYINAGVVSKEEITQSRFGTGRYNYDTILDETLGDRISVTEQAAEQQSEQANEVVDAAKEDRVGENDKVPSPSEK